MLAGLSVGVALSIFVTTLVCLGFNSHYEDTVAGRIVAVEGVITTNREAFRQMAIAGVPVEVARSTSDGTSIYPSGFVLILPNAESAKIHPDGKAYVFFTSTRKEGEIRRMQEQTEKATGAANLNPGSERRPNR